MDETWFWVGWIAGAYLLGSIPFAYLIGRSRGIDIREHGSRNVGASNVGRVLGRKFGAACFVLDVSKGLAPTLGAGWGLALLGDQSGTMDTATMFLWFAVGAAAIAGHTNSIFLGFKGGKGVATAFGAMLGMYPLLTFPVLGAVTVWLAVIAATRYISVASMLAMSSVPVWFVVFLSLPSDSTSTESSLMARVGQHWPFLAVTIVLAGFVIWKHRTNIARLFAGTEAKIGAPRQAYEEPESRLAES